MLAAVSALQESGVTADKLTEELPALPPLEQRRLRGFVRHYKAFERRLQNTRTLDPPVLLQFFRDRVQEKEFEKAFRAAFPEVREIGFDGFDDFSEPEVAFIERLKSLRGVNVWIRLGVIPGNPDLTGYVEENAERFRSIGFQLVEDDRPANPLGERLFNRSTDKGAMDLSSRVTVVQARTRWHEVTAICRLIKRLAAERPGRDLGAICVAIPSQDVYTDIIRERFSAFGIPSNITDRFELSRSPLISDITGLLEIRRHDFERDRVLRVLHSPYLSLTDGFDRGNLLDISRRLRVTSGFRLWLRKIDAEIRFREARRKLVKDTAGESENDGYLEALDRARKDIVFLEELTRGFEGDMTPGEFESRVVALFRRLELTDRLAAPGLDRESSERDARAYARLLDILHETVHLLQERSEALRHDFGYYLDLLKSAVAGERYNLLERAGDGVLVTDLGEARGMPVEVMILAGMEDGSIPGLAEPEIFLSGAMQKAREQKRLQRSRYLFYQAASNWSEHLYITYPLRDAGVDLVRSSFVDAFLEAASVRYTDDESQLNEKDGLLSEEEFLEWYAGHDEEEGAGEIPRRLWERALQVRGGRLIERSRTTTHELREYEGDLTGALSSRGASFLRKIGGAAFSVTELETYGECPFRFLAGNLLGLRSPSVFLEEISALERGYLLHDVLFEFYRERQARALPPVNELSDEEFEDAVGDLEGIAERRLDRIDIPGPFWELEKDYILGRTGQTPGLLRTFLTAERERTDRARPGYFEVAFGQPGNRPGDADPRLSTPTTVKIGEINLRGRIDRIDLGVDCFTVIDYKTGSAVPTLADIRSGSSLQLPLYLRVAEELLAATGVSPAPAGGLYYRLRDPVELQLAVGSARFAVTAFSAPRGSRRVLKQHDELVGLIDAAVARANRYVAAMTRGEFPLAPPEHRETACRWCEFRSMCRVGTVREERGEGEGPSSRNVLS